MGVRTYFAYGSNMSLKRIKKRVPSAKPIGAGILRCHRLEFHKESVDGSGKCDIVVSSAADAVWGRVYHIDDKEKVFLDLAEGLRFGYAQKIVAVESNACSAVCAVTYYATKKGTKLKPYTWYKTHVLKGAEEASLPEDYIERIKAIDAVEDCFKEREARELEIYCC